MKPRHQQIPTASPTLPSPPSTTPMCAATFAHHICRLLKGSIPGGFAVVALLLLLGNLPSLVHVLGGQPLEMEQDTPLLLKALDQNGGLWGSWRWFGRDWPIGSHLYRPVTLISLAVDRAIWGDWAPGYRLTAWVLGVLESFLVAWLLWFLTGSVFAAAVAAVLLAGERWGYDPTMATAPVDWAPYLALVAAVAWWHGARLRRVGKQEAGRCWQATVVAGLVALVVLQADRHTLETVSGWIAARTVHLGTLFGTATLALLAGHAQREERRLLWGAYGAAALAFASYEQSVVLPVVGSLWLAFLHRRGGRAGVRASSGLWVLLAGYVLVRHLVFGLEPSWYHRMQIHVRWKEAYEWAAYVLPPLADVPIWIQREMDWTYPFYPMLWLSLLQTLGWVAVVRVLVPFWRVAVLLFAWKAIAFAPMALLPRYPHYLYFSEAGSVMLGALALAVALGQAGATTPVLRPNGFPQNEGSRASG